MGLRCSAWAASSLPWLLAACSLTLPVKGEFKDGSEAFLGEATGYMDGSGKLTVVSTGGTQCAGEFQYAQSRVTGQGAFKCSDGRVGDFFFTSNGTEGEGFGKTNDKNQFAFRFGGPEYTAQRQRQWDALARSFDSLARTMNPPATYCVAYANSLRCTHTGF